VLYVAIDDMLGHRGRAIMWTSQGRERCHSSAKLAEHVLGKRKRSCKGRAVDNTGSRTSPSDEVMRRLQVLASATAHGYIAFAAIAISMAKVSIVICIEIVTRDARRRPPMPPGYLGFARTEIRLENI
jgi:hypothetical protein